MNIKKEETLSKKRNRKLPEKGSYIENLTDLCRGLQCKKYLVEDLHIIFVSTFDASVDEKDIYGQEKKNSTEEPIQV